jgi:hypothetical protein
VVLNKFYLQKISKCSVQLLFEKTKGKKEWWALEECGRLFV